MKLSDDAMDFLATLEKDCEINTVSHFDIYDGEEDFAKELETAGLIEIMGTLDRNESEEKATMFACFTINGVSYIEDRIIENGE
jgi:hypothetical protein